MSAYPDPLDVEAAIVRESRGREWFEDADECAERRAEQERGWSA